MLLKRHKWKNLLYLSTIYWICGFDEDRLRHSHVKFLRVSEFWMVITKFNYQLSFACLFSQKKSWEEMDPEDRPKNFIPQKFKNLRSVPGYSNFIQERFERCLDLYLCPRQRKIRVSLIIVCRERWWRPIILSFRASFSKLVVRSVFFAVVLANKVRVEQIDK